MATSRFDYDEAEVYLNRLLEARRGDPVWESAALFELGAIRLGRGRLQEAQELTLRAFELSTQIQFGFGGMPLPIFRAQIEAEGAMVFLGDAARTLDILDLVTGSEVWADAPAGQRAVVTFARLYAAAGRPDRARSLLTEYDEGGAGLFGTDPSAALGQIAITEQRYQDAIEEYRRWERSSCTICGLRELGEAYDLAGQADSALVVYEQYLETPTLYRTVTDGTGLWRTLVSLAALYESRGRIDDAIRTYQRFVDLWEDADPELQLRVQEARRTIERLQRD